MLERIGSGDAIRAASPRKTLALHDADKNLHVSWLSSLRVESFRPVHDGKESFDFGQVTLITGPNGTGKTSLLEAIEFFYCGQNRRALTKSGKVHGKLWGSDKEHLATSDSSRLRARCLHWYNREEKTSAGLLNGFGRYNFLDTDAAFRVAVDLSPEELPDDLSRLIVGPDASQIWSYLTKLGPEVNVAAERAYIHLQEAQKKLEASQSKLRELQERPSDAKVLSEAFRARLLYMGYRGRLPTAPFVSEDEAKPIQAAYSSLQVLLSAGPSLLSLASLDARVRDIEEAHSAVERIDEEVKSLVFKLSSVESEADEYETWAQLLERWAEYVRKDYFTVRGEYHRCIEEVRNFRDRLGVFASAELPVVDPSYESVRLVDALYHATQAIQLVNDQINSLQEISESFGRAAAVRARAAQDLKTAVLAALSSGAPATACPVCKVDHGEAVLAAHIEKITAELAQPAELTETSAKLDAALRNREQWSDWKSFLEYLQKIAGQLSVPNTQFCGEIVKVLSSTRRDLEHAESNVQNALVALTSLHDAGMADDESETLFASVVRVSLLTEDPYNISVVEAQAQAYRDAAIKEREKIPALRSWLNMAQIGLDSRISPLFEDGWRTRASASEGIGAFAYLHPEAVALQNARNELLLHFDVGNETKLSDVEATLAGALRAASEAFHAAVREQTASGDISRLVELIDAEKKYAAESQLRYMNIKKAAAALSKLLSELSLESATAKSLSAIGREINEAFVRIHSPSEYEYVGSDGVLLRSKEGLEDWTLDKVSTGQRAAFALSVFLAVNRTAAMAPPVILIDDPVAHVDDLNALSFLDYLRDLAVTSKKQVFFATADTRVAALFARKFGFLGNNFKRIDLLREVEVD